MNRIDPRFNTLFSQLTDLHDRIEARVKRFEETGKALEGKLTALYSEMQPRWLELTGRLWEMDCGFSPDEKRAHRDFVRRSGLTARFRQAPYYRQIITKPRGYAGDARMMDIIYENRFDGPTPFAKYIHYHAVRCDACQAVRNRRQFLRRKIRECGGGRILSLAAGPAREIQDVLTCLPKGHRYRFLALDHDIATLKEVAGQIQAPCFEYALANAFHLIKGRDTVARPRRHALSACNPLYDFNGLRRIVSPLKYRMFRLKPDHFDLVYTAGLYDYIETFPNDPAKGTAALTRRLFDLVKPGGKLIIGNFNETMPPDIRFTMEFICDWNLIYRTRTELMECIQAIPGDDLDSPPEIVTEPLGLNAFLQIKKRNRPPTNPDVRI